VPQLVGCFVEQDEVVYIAVGAESFWEVVIDTFL